MSSVVIGAFGKHPARRDFVRWGQAGELSAGFEAWLGGEFARAPRRAEGPPGMAIRFALKKRGRPRLLVGSWIESSDALGRRFPLIGYAEVDIPSSALLELTPMVTARFDGEIEALLAGASAEIMAARMPAISPPGEDDWEIAEKRFARFVSGLTVRGWGKRIFGEFTELVPSAIDSAVKLAEAARRSAGRPVSACFPGFDLCDLAIWLRLFGWADSRQWTAWLALWEPGGASCALGLGEPHGDLVAALRPEAGVRARAWRFDPAHVQDLGPEYRDVLDRPLSRVFGELGLNK